VIYREREYGPDQEYGAARDYDPAYDEQSVRMRPSATSANGSGYWYYCKQSNAYYPYVRRCGGGWGKCLLYRRLGVLTTNKHQKAGQLQG